MKTVDRLNFKASEPQFFNHRPYYSAARRCDYQGRCVVCQRRTYTFQDGGNDPRGPLGDNAACFFVASEYDNMEGPDVTICFNCDNEEDRYNIGLIRAKELWTEKKVIQYSAETCPGKPCGADCDHRSR